MSARSITKRLELAFGRAIYAGLEKSQELQGMLRGLKRKGFRVSQLIALDVRIDRPSRKRPPLKRAPRKWGRRDAAFLQGLGISPK